MQAKKMASGRRNVHLVKIGEKPVGDRSKDICKDKESNLDQLLATKAKIIQSKLSFCFACVLSEVTIIYNFALNNSLA